MATNYHHPIFGFFFFIVSIVSLSRVYLYRKYLGKARVITLFYLLIFITSLFRLTWFIVFSFVDSYYLPIFPISRGQIGWRECLISEVLSTIGSFGLYLIFILIACYWNQLLCEAARAAFVDEPTDHNLVTLLVKKYNISMQTVFIVCLVTLLSLSSFSVTLFYFKVFNSEDMLMFDSIVLAFTSLITLLVITSLSKRIQDLLVTVGAINHQSTHSQVRRIVAITYATNFFLLCRVATEIAFLVSLVALISRKYLVGLHKHVFDHFILFCIVFSFAFACVELCY